jgi:hypothetical protein
MKVHAAKWAVIVLIFAAGCGGNQETVDAVPPGKVLPPAGFDAGSDAAVEAGQACHPVLALPTTGLLQDSELLNRDPRPEMPVYAFSQSEPPTIDPQLFGFGPAVSIRTTNQWGATGTETSDYSPEAIQRLQALGSRVVLGLTATVVLASQFATEGELLELVSRDASGQPVRHDEIVPGAYRGNLAHPKFRDLVVRNAKTLVDVGADGIFFDEANAGYSGNKYDGNEGFDDYHEADFRSYLCHKHPDWTPSVVAAKFGLPADNMLDCSAPNCIGQGFSVRQYLKDQGLSATPSRANPAVAAEWGAPVVNRLSPAPTTFLQTYETAYWADIVRRVRQYAREVYHREILVTSNGLFPFVDFQSVGLYPWNPDSPDGATYKYVEYVPTVAGGKLNAKVSLLDAFCRLRAQSRALAGNIPVVLFLDWPTDMMSAYYAFSPQEKKDYFRIYGAEAYAAGLRFAWHLKTAMPADPTAQQSGMLEWFVAEADFYRRNAALYLGAQPASVFATTSTTDITLATTSLADGGLAMHVINHAYQDGLLPRDSVAVTVGVPATLPTARAISPDAADDTTIPVSSTDTTTTFVLPSLVSYAVVVVR